MKLIASSLLMLVPALALAAPPPGIPDGWSDGYYYSEGARLHYYHAKPAPGKPVIVMVHGVTDNGLCWTTLSWELEKDFDIYMLDARGHGLSDPFTASDDKDTMIKDIVTFVKTMGFEKPILMGHSMGGAGVIRVGSEYPDLARAIVVLDAGISAGGPRRGPPAGNRPPPPPRPASSDPLAFSMVAEPEVLVKQNNYKFEDLVAKGHRDNPKWSDVDIQYWALSKKQYHGAYDQDTFREVMQGSMRSENGLASITVPMIILKADAPPEQRKAHQEAASVMQKGKLVHIDGAAHNLHHDQLDRTVEVLHEFFSTL